MSISKPSSDVDQLCRDLGKHPAIVTPLRVAAEVPPVNHIDIDVSDVCEAIFTFIEHEWKGVKDHVFNVATQTRLSLIDLINEINTSLKKINTSHVEISPTFGPERVGDIRHSMADNSRLIDATGWQPKIQFSDGIFELVENAYQNMVE